MRNGRRLTEVLKALVEVTEADGAQDRAHQSKEAARSGNARKEGPCHESLTEGGGNEHRTPATQHCCGDKNEDAHEDFTFLANGGPAKVYPGNHQLRGGESMDIYQTNSHTYNAHNDRDSLVQEEVRGLSPLLCSQEEVHPETHGSEYAKEGELETNREREDDLVYPVNFQGGT